MSPNRRHRGFWECEFCPLARKTSISAALTFSFTARGSRRRDVRHRNSDRRRINAERGRKVLFLQEEEKCVCFVVFACYF